MIKKVHKLKSEVEQSKNKSHLRSEIKKFIKKHPYISSIAFWKKRKKVYIEKWEEVNISKKTRYTLNRLQSFFCWIELIKKAEYLYKNNKDQYEIIWITPSWITIIAHIRSEKNKDKDRYLFYISSYFKN